QTEGDSTLRLRHMRLAVDGDRVLAHVRIFARTMLVRGVPVTAGGIGSVASHPDARGAGYVTALLRDADAQMRREGMGIAFLFTGIPAFYERTGWRLVRQPGFDADAAEAAGIPANTEYRVRRIRDNDFDALRRIYRRATSGNTGAIVRTPRTWRDAQRWLDEDAEGCLVAERSGDVVAYARSRTRDYGYRYGYQLLEAEHVAGEEAAIDALVTRAAKRASTLGLPLTALVPADHALAAVLRGLPSTRESTTVTHPMMMRVASLRGLLVALLPQISVRANAVPGPSFRVAIHAPDGERHVLDIRPTRVRAVGNAAPSDYDLHVDATLDALVGQRAPGVLLRPHAPVEVQRRMDALLPPVPLHFWNSDRI
ncbi:MAG TPA: GNAT family N-acetyltransferase, partial [Dehalococcoidia bacterium]